MKNDSKKPATLGRIPVSQGEDKYNCILDSAVSLFAIQGIAGTTISQVAQKAKVTSAMVHYYFQNRDGLVSHVVTERLAPAMKKVWFAVDEAMLVEPAIVIIQLINSLLDVVEKMPELPLLWNREILNIGGLLREPFFSIIPQHKVNNLINFFKTAQKNGLITSTIAPNLIFPSIIASIMVPLAAQTFTNKIPMLKIANKETLRQHVISLILNGVLVDNSKREDG